MSAAAALLAYAVVVGTGGAALLRGCRWPQHAPRLGVAAWQGLSVSVLGALVLAGLLVVLPGEALSNGLAGLLDACVLAVRAQYATPGGAVVHVAAGIGTLTVVARAGYFLSRGLRQSRRGRVEHLAGLRLTARRDATLNAYVVEHPVAVAYCLPGRRAGVVLTSAATTALGQDELAAVLAHERAHLRGRHHFLLCGANALAATVPCLPVFAWAATEQAALLELVADDVAAQGGTDLAVARALVLLADGTAPAATLAAADREPLARVQRLLAPRQHLGLLRRVAIATVLAGTVVGPGAIAVAPMVAATAAQTCPISPVGSGSLSELSGA